MAKHKYIETPEKMWELFCAYVKEVKQNPIQIVEQKKGTVIIPKNFEGDVNELYNTVIHLPKQRPLTLEGFENYLADNEIIGDISDYFENKDNRYEMYIPICKRIKRTIRQDQIEGGMAGIYNPSITQRLNGLTEKTDVTSGGQKILPNIIVQNQETANEINKLINEGR